MRKGGLLRQLLDERAAHHQLRQFGSGSDSESDEGDTNTGTDGD